MIDFMISIFLHDRLCDLNFSPWYLIDFMVSSFLHDRLYDLCFFETKQLAKTKSGIATPFG